MNKDIDNLSSQLKHGLFADRPTLAEAYDYVITLANANKQNGADLAIFTAVHVMMNTIANELDNLNKATITQDGAEHES